MMLTLDDLTPRLRDVALLVGEGKDYSEIAGALDNLNSVPERCIAVRTVRVHVQTIDRQLVGVEGSTPYRRVMRWVLDQQRAA